MPKHADFQKIHSRFIKQYGKDKGQSLYFAWIKKKGHDDTKPFPKGKERKELQCSVIGLEIKELGDSFHVQGLIATSHVDSLTEEEGIEIPDMIPKETLESFALQMNTTKEARIMGIHHSEGNPINPEYFGEADVTNTPAEVIQLADGEWGLFVDTKLLKDDPKTPEIIERFQTGDLNSFSITYDTDGFLTTDFDWVGDNLVRILNPETGLHGYTGGNNPVNRNAVATNYGFKEFKELVRVNKDKNMEGKMSEEETKTEAGADETADAKDKDGAEDKDSAEDKGDAATEENKDTEAGKEESEDKNDDSTEEESEQKEFQKYKAEKREMKEKILLDKTANKIADGVLEKMETKEKVLKTGTDTKGTKEVPLEIKEFNEMVQKPTELEIKEQFRRAAAASDAIGLDWQEKTTSAAESREYKHFGVRGRSLEYKGLGITTNQNTDTDYLQSSAELQDMYDPIIYNALNQATVAWNLLAKDDYSKKGNNQVQFTLKTAVNPSAAFYSGNSVTTDNVTRLKYQTKFKKLQVGVSVDGDMIAAARGGPVNDVFAQEVMDSTMDMLEVLNVALFAEVGLESAAAVIGFEYITDSAGNTSLYNLTRSAANKLAPDSAGDTYINQASSVISMANLRAAKRQATNEGAKKRSLIFITNPVQADLLRGKFDDSRRMLTARDTDFGFSTDLFVDGIPIFEDTDCNTDDWFLIDTETHRVGMWVPPTIERLGKTADSEDAFVKMYLAVYNRAPRRMVQIYGCATS